MRASRRRSAGRPSLRRLAAFCARTASFLSCSVAYFGRAGMSPVAEVSPPGGAAIVAGSGATWTSTPACSSRAAIALNVRNVLIRQLAVPIVYKRADDWPSPLSTKALGIETKEDRWLVQTSCWLMGSAESRPPGHAAEPEAFLAHCSIEIDRFLKEWISKRSLPLLLVELLEKACNGGRWRLVRPLLQLVRERIPNLAGTRRWGEGGIWCVLFERAFASNNGALKSLATF